MNRLKQFFGTPQRVLITLLCMAAVIALLGAGTVFVTTAIARNSSIGEENAKNFAFADLGIDPLSAQNVDAEFDFEQGHFVYQIEFMAEGVEYEYWIKASDGAIVKKEMDIAAQGETQTAKENKVQKTAVADSQTVQQVPKETKEKDMESPAPQEGQTGDGTEIDLDAAKEIVISDAGVSESDVTYTKTELEYEEGVQVYEIEFYTSTDEYEYEINAVTGVIRSKDKEAFHTNIEGNHQNTGADIGVEQAKSIAVSHAGLSEAEVSFSKAKLEKEDGNLVYEIKFYKDGMEYEYEILAATGEIIKFDSEWDD